MICPVCQLGPIPRPDEHGQHPDCTRHLAERVVALPCAGCGGLTSAHPDTAAEEIQCSMCRDGLTPRTRAQRVGADAAP